MRMTLPNSTILVVFFFLCVHSFYNKESSNFTFISWNIKSLLDSFTSSEVDFFFSISIQTNGKVLNRMRNTRDYQLYNISFSLFHRTLKNRK